MNKVVKNIDIIICIISLFMIVFPTIIFFIGFTKLYISIPMSILSLYLSYKYIKNYKKSTYKSSKKYWIIVCIVLFIWLFYSGIGGFSYQNVVDFHVRNAMLRDLINYNWPVIYKKYGLVYYLSFFLPSALVGKIFGFKIATKFLFIYSYIFLICIFYLINRYLKKDSYVTLIIFILFSGLDALGMPNKIFSLEQLEWWCGLFQFSSNTASLYWVFNQILPIWLITILILNIKDSKNILFISSLSFFYSPYATICLIPVSLYLFIKNSDNLKNDIFSLSMLYAGLVAIILGLYYITSTGSFYSGFIFNIVKNKFIIIPSYILLILLEIFMYYIFSRKKYKKDILFKIIIIELLLIPFYVITIDNDFCMRGSVPILFILMIYFINYLLDDKYKKIKLLYILLFISFINPFHEIFRSFYYTYTTKDYIADDIVSIGNPQAYESLIDRQFYGNRNSFYFKYISK